MKGISAGLLLLLFCPLPIFAQPQPDTFQQQLQQFNTYEQRYEDLLAASIDSIKNSIPAITDTLLKIDMLLVYIDRLHGQIDASRGEEELKLSYALSKQISYQRGVAKSLKSLGDIYSAKGDFAKANEHIMLINNTLENTVSQRTRQLEKQNRQLINYAFYNAHKLRGPLARILGLVYLLKSDNGNNPEETQLYISKLEQSSVELDQVVKEINTILQTQDVFDEQVNDEVRDNQ